MPDSAGRFTQTLQQHEVSAHHTELFEMMLHMGQIIRRQKAQSNGLAGANPANCLQSGRGNVRNHMREIAVVRRHIMKPATATSLPEQPRPSRWLTDRSRETPVTAEEPPGQTAGGCSTPESIRCPITCFRDHPPGNSGVLLSGSEIHAASAPQLQSYEPAFHSPLSFVSPACRFYPPCCCQQFLQPNPRVSGVK